MQIVYLWKGSDSAISVFAEQMESDTSVSLKVSHTLVLVGLPSLKICLSSSVNTKCIGVRYFCRHPRINFYDSLTDGVLQVIYCIFPDCTTFF